MFSVFRCGRMGGTPRSVTDGAREAVLRIRDAFRSKAHGKGRGVRAFRRVRPRRLSCQDPADARPIASWRGGDRQRNLKGWAVFCRTPAAQAGRRHERSLRPLVRPLPRRPRRPGRQHHHRSPANNRPARSRPTARFAVRPTTSGPPWNGRATSRTCSITLPAPPRAPKPDRGRRQTAWTSGRRGLARAGRRRRRAACRRGWTARACRPSASAA